MTESGGNLLDVMGHQDQGRSIGVGGQIGQSGDELLAAAEVQAGCGFVEQQQFGIGHQRSGDQDTLALALREGSVGPISQMLGTNALEGVQRTQIVHHVILLTPSAQYRVAGGYYDVPDRLLVRNPLRQSRTTQSDALAQICHIRPTQSLPQDHCGTRRRKLHGGSHPQQRGLAGTIGADHHPALIEFDLPVHRPDKYPAAPTQGDTPKVDQQVPVDHPVVLCVSHGTIVPYPDHR